MNYISLSLLLHSALISAILFLTNACATVEPKGNPTSDMRQDAAPLVSYNELLPRAEAVFNSGRNVTAAQPIRDGFVYQFNDGTIVVLTLMEGAAYDALRAEMTTTLKQNVYEVGRCDNGKSIIKVVSNFNAKL